MGYNSTYRAHDITVHDCDLSHNLTGAYFSYCDTGTVYELVCDDNLRGPGITTGEEYGIALQTVSNFTIHDFSCTNGRCGIEIWAFIFGHDPYPLSGPSDNNHVYNGILANNTQNGFIISEGCASYIKLEYIDSYNNGQGGFNISEGHGAGVGCHVYNCIAYNNDTGNGGYGNFHFGSPCAGWTLKNNIAFAVTGYAFRCTHASGFQGIHAHNDWWKASGNIVDNYGTYYTTATIATWEADGGKSVDPLFISTTPGNEDFNIQNSSTLIDMGEDVGLTADILGRPIV